MRLLLPIIFMLMVVFPVKAETIADFCKGIENTTDMVECLSKYDEQTRQELSENFQEKFDALEEDNAALFKEAQQNWITYRNSECDWEVKNEKTESLKRVRELHCLIRMTKARQNTINDSQQDIQKRNKAQGVKPRWENILYADYPNIFWNKNNLNVSDLDCNDQNENAVFGIKADEKNDSQNFVVAFVENTETGRPTPFVFELPKFESSEDEETMCGNKITFAETVITDQEECTNTSLRIQNGNCGSYTISSSDEEGFVFEKWQDPKNLNQNESEAH